MTGDMLIGVDHDNVQGQTFKHVVEKLMAVGPRVHLQLLRMRNKIYDLGASLFFFSMLKNNSTIPKKINEVLYRAVFFKICFSFFLKICKPVS